MQRDRARYIKWHNRYWHDWPHVCDTVYETAVAHARYLVYDVRRWGGYGPPPGDLGEIEPVMRITLFAFALGNAEQGATVQRAPPRRDAPWPHLPRGDSVDGPTIR